MCLTIPLFGDTVYSCCKSGDTSCSTREWSWNYLWAVAVVVEETECGEVNGAAHISI